MKKVSYYIITVLLLFSCNKTEEYKLVIALDPDDCKTCLDEIDYIIDKYSDKLMIVLVGNYPNKDLFMQFARSYAGDKRVDIMYDINLKINSTPRKVLYDKNNNIIFNHVADIEWKETNKTENEINKYIQ